MDEAVGVGGILRRKGSATRRDLTDVFAEKTAAASSSASGVASNHQHQRKRSILKHDSFEVSTVASVAAAAPSEMAAVAPSVSGGTRLRGVLKKDSSYDEGLKPILKHSEGESEQQLSIASVPAPSSTTSSSSSSSEDLRRRPFSDVIIDPIPGASSAAAAAGRRSSEAFLDHADPTSPPSSATATTHHSRKASLNFE